MDLNDRDRPEACVARWIDKKICLIDCGTENGLARILGVGSGIRSPDLVHRRADETLKPRDIFSEKLSFPVVPIIKHPKGLIAEVTATVVKSIVSSMSKLLAAASHCVRLVMNSSSASVLQLPLTW